MLDDLHATVFKQGIDGPYFLQARFAHCSLLGDCQQVTVTHQPRTIDHNMTNVGAFRGVYHLAVYRIKVALETWRVVKRVPIHDDDIGALPDLQTAGEMPLVHGLRTQTG